MAYSSQAAIVLKHYGVIAHQTDTVIGLACLPIERLMQRLCRIKHRKFEKSFILLASSIQQLDSYIQINNSSLSVINTPYTQPTTWLVQANDNVPSFLIGNTNKIAIRISQHINVKSICDQVGAVVSTSANIAEQEMCRNMLNVRTIFGPSIDYIDQNQASGTAKSSSIIDLETGKILRR